MPKDRTFQGARSRAPRVVIGWMLMGAGALLMLTRLDLFDLGVGWARLWPLALVGLGASKLWQTWGTLQAGSGLWLVLTGLWLLAVNLRTFGLTLASSWPLLLVATGITMVLRSLPDRTAVLLQGEASDGR